MHAHSMLFHTLCHIETCLGYFEIVQVRFVAFLVRKIVAVPYVIMGRLYLMIKADYCHN